MKVECSSYNVTNVLGKHKACISTGTQTKLTLYHEMERGYEKWGPISDAEIAAREPRKQVNAQVSLSSIRLSEGGKRKIKKGIPRCVEAAEVIIQCLYRRHTQQSAVEC